MRLECVVAVVAANNTISVGIYLALNRLCGYDTAIVGAELVCDVSIYLV